MVKDCNTNTSNNQSRSCASSWSRQEQNILKEAVSLYGTRSWALVAEIVGTKSAIQCRSRFHKLQRRMQSEETEVRETAPESSVTTQEIEIERQITMPDYTVETIEFEEFQVALELETFVYMPPAMEA